MPARRGGGPLPSVVRALAVLFLLGAHLPALSLSLGDYEARSALGEPLRLELAIESDHSAGGLPVARLIDDDGAEAWTIAGAALGSIHMEVVSIDDIHQRLQIRSTLPVWEPLIKLRVEVTQASMRVVRELHILLDPPSAQGASEWAAERGQQVSAIDASASLHTPLAATVSPTAAGVDPPIAKEHRTRRRNDPESSTASPFRKAKPPVPRFQLAAALSSSSRAWLEIDPQPQPQATGEDLKRTTTETAPQPASRTAEESAADAKAAIADSDKPVDRAPTATVSAYPRGLPMGSPWRVFFFMVALAAALFIYARRLRRRMMVKVGHAA